MSSSVVQGRVSRRASVGGGQAVSHSQQNNPFYNQNNMPSQVTNRDNFVSQIPNISSQPSNSGNNHDNISNNNNTRRRRNSSGATFSDHTYSNRRTSVATNEPRRKKSKSTMIGTVNDSIITPNSSNSSTNPTLQRRSLQPVRSTSFNGMIYSSSVAASSQRDLRPLRDKNFQNAIQQEILDYLLQNKFDIETNHPVSLKSLKQPTQKGFMIIFSWLYRRIDPGFQFTKTPEAELYQIMKNLKYPYLETINKSQISAVGGSSWHKFLGLLHWLIRLNLKLDKISNKLDEDLMNQPTLEMIQINNQLREIPNSLEEQDKIKLKYESMIENLVTDYTMDTYQMFLNGDDDFKPAMKRFQIGFEKFIRIIQIDINNLENENEKILSQYQDILEKAKRLRISKEKYNALQNDVIAFQNYINVMEKKSMEWPDKLQKMQLDSKDKSQQISNVELQIRNILQELDSKNVSIETIEEKNKNLEFLLQSLDDIADKSDKLTASTQTKKLEYKNVKKNLSQFLNQYNSALDALITRRIELTGRKVNNISDFKIDINSKLDSIDEMKQFDYSNILDTDDNNFSLKNSMTSQLINLLEDIEKNCESVKLEINQLEDSIIQIENEIKDKNSINEQLKEKVVTIQSIIYSTRQEYESQIDSQRSQIANLRIRNERAFELIDKKLDDAKKIVTEKKQKLTDFERQLDLQKSQLQHKVFQIVNYIVEFKLNVQNSLDQSKETLTKELQKLNLNENS